MEDLTKAKWRKSTASGSNGGECVEVASLGGDGYAVRDSKNPNGAAFTFPTAAWTAFVAGVKAGTFG